MEINKDTCIKYYRDMLRIRMTEETIASKYNGSVREMHTPIHLCIGQEAVAVGVCNQLKKDDYVFSNHRDHGHYLAKGGSLDKMIAELFTKNTGCCHGMGGSMHLADKEHGVAVSSSIVAGNVPIATGYAMANKMSNNDNVVVSFFGDGASEEGVVYESICFAAIHNLPIIYVCENNLYAISTGFKPREPLSDIASKFSNICETKVVDGNDVFEVADATSNALDRIKEGKGPCFIECLTYRLKDHHNTKTGVESGYRSQQEWDKWNDNSPITKVEDLIRENCWLTESDMREISTDIERKILHAFEEAHNAELPDTNKYKDYLWA